MGNLRPKECRHSNHEQGDADEEEEYPKSLLLTHHHPG